MTGFRAVSFLTVLSSPLAGCTVFWVFFFFFCCFPVDGHCLEVLSPSGLCDAVCTRGLRLLASNLSPESTSLPDLWFKRAALIASLSFLNWEFEAFHGQVLAFLFKPLSKSRSDGPSPACAGPASLSAARRSWLHRCGSDPLGLL